MYMYKYLTCDYLMYTYTRTHAGLTRGGIKSLHGYEAIGALRACRSADIFMDTVPCSTASMDIGA